MDSDKFLTQYEMEEKFPHTVLKNVKYYDEEENSYCDATLELFGHCTLILTYDDGDLWKTIKNIAERESEVRVLILQEDEDDILLTINDDKYIMDKQNASSVQSFYNELNKEFIIRRIEFKDIIDNTALNLLENESLFELLSNYISQVSYHFFMNYDIIAGFEIILEEENNIGKMLLISNEQLRLSIKMVTEHKEGKTTQYFESFKNKDLIVSYKEQQFDFLVDLLTEEFKLTDTSVASYLTYKLLLKVSIRYFANIFAKEYGDHFNELSKISLFDATEIYCSIDSIDVTNLESAGTFIYFLMHNNNKFENNENYLECYQIIVDLIEECNKRNKAKLFKRRLKRDKSIKTISIDDIDIMNGNEFEYFIAELFNKMGYSTSITKASGDQGIDVIVEKGNNKFGIQTKCYSNTITNKAIQEVVGGLAYYKLDKGIVITNNFFTDSAKELAASNGIILWDRTILKEKISEHY